MSSSLLRRSLVGTVAGLAAATMLAAPAHASAPTVRQNHLVRPFVGVNSTSSNWSGYAVTHGPYNSVTASWTQPSGQCTSKTTYSSFWIGIDGDGSNSVEQTGSEVDCSGGRPVYYAWYEMYPKYPVNFSSTVSPGDHFTASVTATSAGAFTLKISDTTKGWSHTVNKTYSPARRYSAEVIAEAPSSSSGVLPLTNFGTVNFSASTANGAGLGTLNPDAITMQSGSTVKAKPSSISSGGAFSVTWYHS